MTNHKKDNEGNNFELNQNNETNDYENLIIRLKKIRNYIANLENFLTK